MRHDLACDGFSQGRPTSTVCTTPKIESIASRLATQVIEQLPAILHQLFQEGYDPAGLPWQLECSLTTAGDRLRTAAPRVPIAAVDLEGALSPFSTPTIFSSGSRDAQAGNVRAQLQHANRTSASRLQVEADACARMADRSSILESARYSKRRKDNGQHPIMMPVTPTERPNDVTDVIETSSSASLVLTPKRKRASEHPVHQPSTLEKYIAGVWEALYSGPTIDITGIVEQWQTIELNGQSKLLTNAEAGVAVEAETCAFGRMSKLTRKISQTSRNCRSLEVIVQAHWMKCFDDRVDQLAAEVGREKARKQAAGEACLSFQWTEKELRNKMGIWRGYHDIKSAGGWAALVFAGMGLYRFCKYRVSFTEETFSALRALRHRFEVAADTLHPRWRVLLGIIGESTARKYNGHPHDWVVNGPDNEGIPLPETYHEWDINFSYNHISQSIIDEEAWDPYDPRTIAAEDDPTMFKCQNCNEQQSDDPTLNACKCYPNLYGTAKVGPVPIQVFRTRDGKNNGLVACCPFEEGWAVGEFVGLITSGLQGLDVMVGQTDRATYQIWQGKQGNHTRFVNHSCEPNAQFERFVWLGKQRIVLASKGIEAGEEVTVDYGDTYWQNLDKICRCGTQACRYKHRDPDARKPLEPPRTAE